eukprot:11162415-Lingulodinium_polyedra.AAC.1
MDFAAVLRSAETYFATHAPSSGVASGAFPTPAPFSSMIGEAPAHQDDGAQLPAAQAREHDLGGPLL